jgi:hypothetical protein
MVPDLTHDTDDDMVKGSPQWHRSTSPSLCLSLWFSTRPGFLGVGMARTGPRDANKGGRCTVEGAHQS